MQNIEKNLLPSAARTTATTTADQINDVGRGVVVVVNVTSLTDAGAVGVTFTIQGKSASGVYSDILSSAAVTATGTTRLVVYPGITATNNVSASTVLPRTWRVKAAVADASSLTYSVDACTVL